MISSKMKRLFYVVLLSLGCVNMQSAFAQTPELQMASGTPITSADNKQEETVVFPVPTAAEGAELLQYENISFEADETPMPDVAPIVRSARKNKDASSMFITHMMYRDRIGDVAYFDEGRRKDAELSEKKMHREMIRWRDEAVEAGYELALLAKNPSVQYEISPLFSNDDEFKKGLNWLKKAAARGYGNAEYVLGLVYFNGVGTKRDKKKGFELLVRAASHGVINAYYAVGMIYEMGLNGKKNTDKSLYWLEKAVHFGSKDAIFILAMKYADGIDVPQDEKKAAELEKLDTRYHAWTMLHASYNGMFSHRYCREIYDESAIGHTYYVGGCESHVDYFDRFGGYGDEDEEDDEDKKKKLDDIAAFSLDYKIDYRLAALWLKKVANFDREQTYMLRSQTHHLNGCSGGLDDTDFETIILSPHETSRDDYDNYPRAYKKIVISIVDHHVKPSKLRKWLIDKADSGDKDAILTLARLYDRTNYGIYEVTKASGGDYHRDAVRDADYDDNELEVGDESDQKDLAVEFGFYKNGPSKHEIMKNLVKAFEYYERGEYYASAVRDAELLGNDLKKVNYNIRPKTEKSSEWFEKALMLSERGYQHYIQANSDQDDIKEKNYKAASHFAEKSADIARKLGDESKAIEYYSLALAANERLKSLNKRMQFVNAIKLARLYDSGEESVQDKAKASEAYQTALMCASNSVYQYGGVIFGRGYDAGYGVFDLNEFFDEFDDYLKDILEAAERLGNISYEGTNVSSPNKSLATEAYARLWELNSYINTQDKKVDVPKDAIKLAQKLIEELPRMDLQKEVEKQILAEKGKNPDGFFVFKQVLNPCERDDNWDHLECLVESDEVECEYRTCRVEAPYRESLDKAIVAITALNLAGGSFDIEKIRNTFYYLAIYNNWKGLNLNLNDSSAVYRKLVEFLNMVEDRHRSYQGDYYFKDYEMRKVYYIWYLRQIPYAAADKFKTLQTDKSWEEYMNDARELVQQNEQLRTAFGYDPAMIVQKFGVLGSAAK
ncbi:MAG: sel1 repeat family protein [Proteobacteria bacterium]|nr:sel1 repeat family protein [Pseudomonadota bacterium]